MEIDRSKTRKLSLDDVQAIRTAYGQGATQGAIARHFGMSIGQIVVIASK